MTYCFSNPFYGILAVCMVGFFSCLNEDEIITDGLACLQEHNDQLIDDWSNPVFDGNREQCLDTLCLEFSLKLETDSTYQMNYLLFDSNADSLILFELADTGTYQFICEERGVFHQRFTFGYIEGQLLLGSNSEPLRTLNIRWDGFWGLQIQTIELGLEFNTRLILQ